MQLLASGEVALHVDASPEQVYALLGDVTRTGEWSPECHRCEWVGDADGPAVGAQFRGWNRSGLVRWSRLVEIVTAEPDEELAWRTMPDRMNKDSTTWRFVLKPEDGGTLITQSYEIHEPPHFPVNVVMSTLLRHHADMRPAMRESLGRIQTVVERDAS